MTTDLTEKPSTLLQAVMKILDEKQDTSLMVIWRDTGIPYYWLRKVKSGEIKNPGVQRIQALYEYFSGKTLDV